MSYPEGENNPEVTRLKAKMEAFVDVIQNLNIMSEQRGVSIFDQALNETTIQSSEFISHARDEELNERALIHSLVGALRDQTDGIYMTFEEVQDNDGNAQNVVRVEFSENIRNEDTPEIMKIVSPKDKDSNPYVTSTFLQEGPWALTEFEHVIQDLIPDLHGSMEEMIDNKIKRICSAIGIFPSDRLEWHFEEDKLPAIIMEKPLLNALLKYGLNTIQQDAFDKLEDLLEKIDRNEEGSMFFDPYVGWIREGQEYSEVVCFSVIGRTGYPGFFTDQVLYRKDLEEERKKRGHIIFSQSSMILRNHDYDNQEDDKNFYDDETDQYFYDFDGVVKNADNKFGKLRALNMEDENDYRLMRAAMSYRSYMDYFRTFRIPVIDPNTGEESIHEETPMLQQMYEPVRYTNAVVEFTNLVNNDGTKEQSISLESHHQPINYRSRSLIDYRYTQDLIDPKIQNKNPEYGSLDSLSTVQTLNFIRVLLAAPDIATKKRSIDGMI